MLNQNTPVLVGSIIHLLNGVADGGYLDVRGWVADKPLIDIFYDSDIQGLVSTHQSPNRLMGSGSWLVASAEGAPAGTPLKIGAKIHLLNMYLGAGYLDSFEWVKNLKPFHDYPMTIGVFTARVARRGDGPTGTWTIVSATGKQNGEPFIEGDVIYLENGFPTAGFLHSYGKVSEHPLFAEYEGQRLFVFTGRRSESANGSPKWTVSLDSFVENLYEVQNQWGDSNAPWHEGGRVKIGSRPGQPIVKLSGHSTDGGQTLSGRVTYKGEPPTDFVSTHHYPNNYQLANGEEWQLGSRDSQKIVALDIESGDEGRSFSGTITYSDESPIRFKATRQLETHKDPGTIYYDFFYYQRLKGRTTKIESLIETTYRLLADSFQEISGTPLNEALQLIYTTPPDYEKYLRQLLEKTKPNQATLETIDQGFQIRQLLNLHTLSTILNAFLQEQLQELMKRTSAKHQRSKTPAPLHQIREGLRHIANDHEIIQQATIQRRWNKQSDGNYGLSEQAIELLIMDKLAIKAIEPFKHLLLEQPEQLAVITFLSDKTHIHHIPYSDHFLLVGIGYDGVPPADSQLADQAFIGKNFASSELMAIPHEVGHYIYKHGKLKNGDSFPAISQKFAANPYYQWCEELFADLYGCIVAGPLSVLGLQALLVSVDKEQIWHEDKEHPTPMLRVFILADMMGVVEELFFKETHFKQYAFPKMTARLNEDWARILEQWGYERMDAGPGRPHRIYLPDNITSHLDKVVNIKRVLETVRPIVAEFAGRLIKELSSTFSPWVQQDHDSTEPYNQEMMKLSGRDFARQPILQKTVFTASPKKLQLDHLAEDEQLQWYLDNWDDNGPHGWGGH